MKLSEAIRLGAMLTPQAFGTWFDGDSACALGAAYGALGLDRKAPIYYTSLAALFPILDAELLSCPVCAERVSTRIVAGGITHLNDTHRWTREQIADWVATIEPAESVEAEPAPVEEAVTR